MRDTAEALAEIERTIAAGPYAATWESLRGYTVPDWYRDGKFGIFIHWGLYAVPAFGNEWYPRNMYLPGTPEFAHHRATYGPQDQFGYKDFIPQFTADRFDPRPGPPSAGVPARSSWCRSRSTTMASRCTTAITPSGPPPAWDRGAI